MWSGGKVLNPSQNLHPCRKGGGGGAQFPPQMHPHRSISSEYVIEIPNERMGQGNSVPQKLRPQGAPGQAQGKVA